MQLHQVKREHLNKKSRLIGRGGKRGKTSGKGTKGQLARAGRKPRPEMRDIIKKLPKRRGYRFASYVVKPVEISLTEINNSFKDGEMVTPVSLLRVGVIQRVKGKIPTVKILSSGEITKKVYVKGCLISSSAEEAIKKAGGSLVLPKAVGEKVGKEKKNK